MGERRDGRWCVVTTVAALLATGCGASGTGEPTSDGEAACAAPRTTVSDETVTPGQRLTVNAEYMWSDCYDTGQAEFHGNPPPLTRQWVRWTQGSTEVAFGMIDADAETGLATMTVTVPADALAGAAQFTIGRALPADLTVVSGP